MRWFRILEGAVVAAALSIGPVVPYAQAVVRDQAQYWHPPASIASPIPELANRPLWDPLIDYVYSNPLLYGGAYVSPEAGVGMLHVAVVGRNASSQAAVAALVPPGQQVRWDQVRHSSGELREVMITLASRADAYAAQGTRITSLALDVARNSVVLSTSDPIASLSEALTAEFGSVVQVVPGQYLQSVTCVSRYSCTPWRGGIQIVPYSGSGLACTYGFNARSVSSSAQYMITAGHCDNQNWTHNGYSIGTTDLNNLDTSGEALGDFQRVPTFLSTPTNLIYAADSDKSHAVTSYRPYRVQLQGDYVCSFGVASGNRCGNITNSDYYYGISFRGRILYMWGKFTSLISTYGDSGGPVFSNATALGVVSAIDSGGRTAYGTIDNAMTALAVRLCLDASCS